MPKRDTQDPHGSRRIIIVGGALNDHLVATEDERQRRSPATGAQSILNTRVSRPRGAQIDRRELDHQMASVFLVATERVAHSFSLVVVDQPSVVQAEQKTGLTSGGDVSLNIQVKEAQALVKELLNTLLLHKKADNYPGKECGLVYNEDIKVCGEFILHRYAHVDESYVPDPTDDNEDVGNLVQYWHTENLVHPLRHVPGTPWHKFFGNFEPGLIIGPALFRECKPRPFFRVILPTIITWMKLEIIGDYGKYRQMFERASHHEPIYHPGQRLPEFIKEVGAFCLNIARPEESIILCLEDMSEISCPEYDLLGLSRPEALNAEINAPELAGIALFGADIPPVPTPLEGGPLKYCLEWDGKWI
ncbi:hypothetical protein C8A03DRAFT_48248 [Achaetomium macrosporum]|uniref:Uncharacterized protein n=1 Tax=Achaetomium macrosporum TaxID=79813 RepID=A0AAN7C0Y5_9PEZI|nr:hypothetical protein C8A03DRAFT_48248 [Achaetomium macrosporum]